MPDQHNIIDWLTCTQEQWNSLMDSICDDWDFEEDAEMTWEWEGGSWVYSDRPQTVYDPSPLDLLMLEVLGLADGQQDKPSLNGH